MAKSKIALGPRKCTFLIITATKNTNLANGFEVRGEGKALNRGGTEGESNKRLI